MVAVHNRVTICGGVLRGHPRLVADEILALSVANCLSTWRWRDGSSARMGAHRKAPWDKPGGAIGMEWSVGRLRLRNGVIVLLSVSGSAPIRE